MALEMTGTTLPRVAIRFCVQCKWNLRAAYYAQELLSTFAETIGEVALIPVTGGVFTINLYHKPDTERGEASSAQVPVQCTQIWDRKVDGGFPETKELKNRVRNIIDPRRDMGHVDRALRKSSQQLQATSVSNRQDSPAAASGSKASMDAVGHANHTSIGVPEDCAECKEAAAETGSRG